MAGFGQKLRQERESHNFTLAQVAEATRISLRYLEALESDNFAALPGSVFNKGYVRSFAKFVGADPEPLIQAYVAEEELQESEGRLSRPDVMAGLAKAAERNPRRRAAEPGSRIPMLALLALVVLALGSWAVIRFGFSSDDPSPTVAANRVETQEAPPEAAPDVEPAISELPAVETTPVARVEQKPPPPRETRTSTPFPSEPTAEPTPEPARTSTPPPTVERETSSAQPAPAEAPETAVPAEASDISIKEFGVGTDVVNRKLVGQSDRFDPGTRVWFWNRVIGANKGEKIRHVWMHEGKTVSSFGLTLGGSHWRTQSRKTLRAPGRWSVEARDAENRVLARTEFLCDEPS